MEGGVVQKSGFDSRKSAPVAFVVREDLEAERRWSFSTEVRGGLYRFVKCCGLERFLRHQD